MPKKKSLADELAELFSPAPAKEFDPEADVFGAGPALEESDEELAAQPSARRKGKEAERLRGDIVMEGRDYSGRRSSRAAVFGAGEEEEEEAAEEGGSEEEAGGDAGEGSDEGAGGSGSGSEEGDEEGGWLNGNAAAGSGGSSEEEGEDEEPEEAVAGTGGIARRRAARAGGPPAGGGGDSDQDGAGGSSSDEEGQQRSGAAAAVAAAAGDEMAELQREYEQMQQDEQSALEGLKERAAKERRKAVAVQAQKSVWQRGLEARILLQRALAGANRLPQGGMQAAAAGASGELATAFAGLAADAAALLGDLLQLMGALGEQNPAVGEAAAAAAEGGGTKVGAKRRRNGAQQQQEEEVGQCGELWEQLDAAYASFVPFRDASIDRWHRKTLLTTGSATLRGGQLKALNQGLSTQVAQLMQDPSKVLQRTRLPRAAQQQPHQRLLCPDPELQAAKLRRVAEDGGVAQETDQEPAAIDAEDERDPETFDDTEFYQTLLREFLEGSAAAGGGNWNTGPKQRKAVDRRASKGRKLRYHVHEKLVNFMAPVELQAPQFAAQLFSNLFGGGK